MENGGELLCVGLPLTFALSTWAAVEWGGDPRGPNHVNTNMIISVYAKICSAWCGAWIRANKTEKKSLDATSRTYAQRIATTLCDVCVRIRKSGYGLCCVHFCPYFSFYWPQYSRTTSDSDVVTKSCLFVRTRWYTQHTDINPIARRRLANLICYC